MHHAGYHEQLQNTNQDEQEQGSFGNVGSTIHQRIKTRPKYEGRFWTQGIKIEILNYHTKLSIVCILISNFGNLYFPYYAFSISNFHIMHTQFEFPYYAYSIKIPVCSIYISILCIKFPFLHAQFI